MSHEVLYRTMRMGEGNRPRVGRLSSCLGVRVYRKGVNDISVHGGFVQPGEGGLSVIPDDPMKIVKEFRPKHLGGTGEDPVWCMPLDQLGEGLSYRPDPRRPGEHGVIEPAYRMPLEQYEAALAATSTAWEIYWGDRETT